MSDAEGRDDVPIIKVNQTTGHQTGGESIGLKVGEVGHIGTITADTVTVFLQSYGARDGATEVQVPPVARHRFFGRDQQKQAIATVLRDRGCVLVHGTVGMGKTALAAAVAIDLHREAVYEHGVVWISEIGTAPLSAVCDAVARQLGDREIPRLPAPAKADALRSLLASRPNMLLVLDALDDPATARGLLDQCLPSRVALLATSQTVHAVFDVDVAVRPLHPSEAIQLFEDRGHVAAGTPLVAEICDVVGRHPQAIVLAAGRRRVEQIPLDRLLARLSDERERLLTLDGSDDEGTGLRAALGLAVAALKEEQRATFAWLAACFGDWTTVPLLARARSISESTCEDHVGQLARRSLLERDDTNQLLMQRVVRDIGRIQPEADLAVRRHSILLALIHYAAMGNPSSAAHHARLEAELSNLLGAVRFAAGNSDWASTLALVEALAHPVAGVLAVRGHWEDLVMLLDIGIQAAGQIQDDSKRAWFCSASAIARSRRGEREEAKRLYTTALRIFRRLRDRPQLAKVLHNIGKLLQEQGNYKGARRAYARSLRLKDGLPDPMGTARTWHEMGRLASHEGRYAEARESFARSLAVKRTLDDRPGMAVTTFNVARVDHTQGDYTCAHAGYRASHALYEALEDHAGVALVQHYRGRLAYDEGHLETADTLYQSSYREFDALRSTQELADVIHDRAVLAMARRDFANADAALERSLVLKAQLGDRSGHALGQLEQVRSHRLQGRLDAARDILTDATLIVVALGEQASVVRAWFEAGCLNRVTTGDETAREPFTNGLALAESLGLRMEMAEHHEQLGEIDDAAGDRAAARVHLGKSLELFERLNETRAAALRARLKALEIR